MKVKQFGIKCLECGVELFSNYTHDFKYCTCGATSVDGGHSYFKRSTTEGKKWEYCERVVDIHIPREYIYFDAQFQMFWISTSKMKNAKRMNYYYIGIL